MFGAVFFLSCTFFLFSCSSIECAGLLETRKKYFEERSLYSLFRKVISEIIFDFLREIGVFLSNMKCVEVMFV